MYAAADFVFTERMSRMGFLRSNRSFGAYPIGQIHWLW